MSKSFSTQSLRCLHHCIYVTKHSLLTTYIMDNSYGAIFYVLYFAGLVKCLHSLKEIKIYGDHVPQQKTANHREIAYSIENC